MCDELTQTHHIFLTRDGRISIAGLNADNIEYAPLLLREPLPAHLLVMTWPTCRVWQVRRQGDPQGDGRQEARRGVKPHGLRRRLAGSVTHAPL